VTSDTTVSAATLFITTTNSGQNNQLYIMYIATDHDFLGVFMPGPLGIFFSNLSHLYAEPRGSINDAKFCF